jgi:uncharacterized protein YyaL (SSP411 family)
MMQIRNVLSDPIATATFAKLVLTDATQNRCQLRSKVSHLNAAVDWLKLAHDKANGRGVSYGYSIAGGWRPPYRETTGYIAVTFFNLARFLEDEALAYRAFRMCDWELTVQNENGSFSNPHFDSERGIVFDTGQVLFGLVRAYEESQDERYLAGAVRAGRWLVDIAGRQRRWTRSTHNGIPHVYNSRVAWALLRLNQNLPRPEWCQVARANLDFALDNKVGGWLDQCAFQTGVAPFTHTIAYAVRGLYESSQILGEDQYQKAAADVAESCLSKLGDSGAIPGQIAIDGTTVDSFSCLTGNCQLAIVWAKLHKLTGEERYKTAALRALRYVMSRQSTDSSNANIKGAIKGSYPIWGPYSRLTYPNWSTKFFVDAMLECWGWL